MTEQQQQTEYITKTQVRKDLYQHLKAFHTRVSEIRRSLISLASSDEEETIQIHEYEIKPINEWQDIRQKVEASPELLEGIVTHIADIEASLSTLENDVECLERFWDEEY